MIEQFLVRNFSKTIQFLSRVGIYNSEMRVADNGSLKEKRSIIYHNEGNYLMGVYTLQCKASRAFPENMVFCMCCSPVSNFLRNYSLFLYYKEHSLSFKDLINTGINYNNLYSKYKTSYLKNNSEFSKEFKCNGTEDLYNDNSANKDFTDSKVDNKEFKRFECFNDFIIQGKVIFHKDFHFDPFCEFLIGLMERDIQKLVGVIEQVPLFWDCCLALLELTTEFVYISGPLAPYFYMLLKVKKDIDPPASEKNQILGKNPTIDDLPYSLEYGDLNLLAAFLFACDKHEDALSIFNGIFFGKVASVEKINSRKNTEIIEIVTNVVSIIENLSDGTLGGSPFYLQVNTSVRSPISVQVINNMSNGLNSIEEYIKNRENYSNLNNIKNYKSFDNTIKNQKGNRENYSKNIFNAKSENTVNNEMRSITIFNSNYSNAPDNNEIDAKFVIGTISYAYVDIYAYLLGNKDKEKLTMLLQAVTNEFPNTPEYYAVRGISYTANKNFIQAVAAFKKSLRLNYNPDVICMLGHAYAQTNNIRDAENSFYKALSNNTTHYRIVYAVAHGFFLLDHRQSSNGDAPISHYIHIALHYAHKALSLREDSTVWKLVGRIYIKLNENALALRALNKSYQLGLKDSMLYIAEIYKNIQKPEKAIEIYEEYIKHTDHNKKAIVKYLIDYYQETKNFNKLLIYKEILKEIE